MVLADSDGIPRVPPYSGALLCQLSVLHTGLSPSLVLLSNRVLLQIVIHVVESPTTPVCMHTGLGSSRFARRYSGNRFFFLFLRVMRCFSSPRSLMKSIHVSGLGLTGCPIRISADQFVCADSRSFSQLITSFFASESLGIHRLPLLTFVRPAINCRRRYT